MNIRKITREEYLEASKIFHLAFGIKSNKEENVEFISQNPKSRFELYYLEKWAAFDKNNKMMAVAGTIPYTIRFDGSNVLMSGISGVSTLPEFRRQGVMGAVIKTYLKDQYHNNYAFSYLYPFSTAYYNKFGYEKCCENIKWELNIKAIKPFDIKYQVFMHEKGSHTEDIRKVYNNFMNNYNMSVVRENIDFVKFNYSDPEKDGQYTYLFKNDNNEPIAVLSFIKKIKDNIPIMFCKDLYFINVEGLKAILNHVYTYKTYYQYIEFFLPIDIRITEFLNEWALQYTPRHLQFKGMARVINVEKVLKLAKYKDDGELIIKINDSIINENNHTFKITFKNNKFSKLSIIDIKPDIELGIDDFSRLIIGTHDLDEFKYLPKVIINSNYDNIKKMFYKKKNMIYDSF